jgi:hypothetical protein
MLKKLSVLVAIGLVFLGFISSAKAEVCPPGATQVTVRGKIINNAVGSGTTLGSVHMILGEKGNQTTMKCGITGLAQNVYPAPGPHFIHTIVCDDQTTDEWSYSLPNETIHSQITLATSFESATFQTCPAGHLLNYFTEKSIPLAGSGRGVFYGVSGGEIWVTGEMQCSLAIDMDFQGYMSCP